MITMMTNPKGTGKSNFSRIDEYVFFVVPDLGYDIMKGRPVAASLDPSIFEFDIEDDSGSGDEGTEEGKSDEETELLHDTIPPSDS